MANRVLQLKRYRDIYPDKDNALRSLNAYVAANIDVLRDGEPIIGHYFEEGKCKVLVGIIHKLREDSVNGVNWINADDNGQSLTPADSSISITDGQIKVNIENGAFVSLQEILEAVPATDLSEIEGKIDKIHSIGFGGQVTDETTAEDLYAEDDRLSAATSLVDADKMLSRAIDDNSLVVAAALNDINKRLTTLSGNSHAAIDGIESSMTEIVLMVENVEMDVNALKDDVSDITSGITEVNRAMEDNELVIAAALNDVNDRLIGLEENTVTEITSGTFKIERTGGSVNIDFEDGIIDFGEY